MPLQKSLQTYWTPHAYIYIYIYTSAWQYIYSHTSDFWQEVEERMCEKKKDTPRRKGGIWSHLSGSFQTNRTFFHPAASKVAHLFAKSPEIRMRVVSATGELTRWNKFYEKHPTLDLSTTGDD